MNARFSQRLLAGFLAAASMAGITLTAAAEYPKPQSERYIGDASYFSNTTKPQSLTLKRGEASQFGLIDTIFVDENGNEYTIKVTDNDASKTPNTALPASYNSYDHGISTPVQNQNPYGSCWSFAGCAAAEGSMIYQGLAAGNTNYSEKHMVWFTLGKGPTDTSDPTYGDCENLGYDSYDRGGYDMDPIMTLAKWSGAELDSKVPFNVSSNNYSVDESYRYDSYAHIEDANFLDITNRNAIKQAIMESGELFFTYNHRFAAENDDTIFTYYNPSKTTYDGGHAVTLVGWDDNFSKDKFSTVNGLAKPSSNGAWLIKNSWGTGYGNNGFMWVSYEEATIKRIIQYRMAKTDNYDNNYQWDGNFYDSYWNSNGYANVFTAKSNEELKAVSTFFLESGYGCTLKIYTDITDKANPTSGKLAYSTTFDTAMGYHTYKLPSSIKLDKGENFAVWFDTQSFIVIDSNAYAENTTLTKSGSSWINCSFNASIKAFTDSEAVAKPQNVKAAVSGDKQVTVSWDSVAGATSYRVFRADSATGTKTLLKAVSTTSYTDTTVSTGKTYYYFVAAYNSATGKLSDYSAYAMVKVQTPLAAPTISAISTNGSSVTLNWSTVTGATSYRVYRADSAAGTKTLLKAVSTATYTDTTVTSGKTYYYFVAAYDSATDRLSAYSAAKSIKVQTPLAAPTISEISTNGSSVTLKWSTVTGATSYRIYRADSATGTKTLLKAVSTATYTDTTVTSGKTYYYFVAAYDSATSRLSAYSAAKSIKVQTPLAAPTISAISTNGSSVTLKWSTVTGATSYRIYRADSATGTKTLLKGVAATTYTDTTVTSGKTYYYFVAAYDSATSRLSAYSAAKSIKVQTPLAAPTISAISTTGSSVTLKWSTVTGATSYRIYRADSATGTKTLLKGVAATTYTDTTVTSGKTYYYFVAAYDSATARLSAYSAAKSIKVQTPLAAPTISAISTNGSSVTLNWSTVTGATSYRIYRADSATGTKTLLKGVATTTYTDTTVTSGKTYYYFVAAYNSTTGTLSAYSAAKSIKVQTPLAAPTISAISTNGSSVTLKWSTVTGATSYRIYRADTATGTKTLLKAVTTATYTDTTVSAGKTYYYFVAAYDSATDRLSAYSAVKSIKVS